MQPENIFNIKSLDAYKGKLDNKFFLSGLYVLIVPLRGGNYCATWLTLDQWSESRRKFVVGLYTRIGFRGKRIWIKRYKWTGLTPQPHASQISQPRDILINLQSSGLYFAEVFLFVCLFVFRRLPVVVDGGGVAVVFVLVLVLQLTVTAHFEDLIRSNCAITHMFSLVVLFSCY